jgi:putative transposase
VKHTPIHRKKLHHYNTPGHAHELTFSCYRRSDYFLDPKASEIFLQVISEAKIQYRFRVWAYVIMPNHVHLLLWPQDNKYDIAKIDCGIKGVFSKRYAAHLSITNHSKYEEFIIENRGKKTFRFWQVGGGFDRNLWNAKAIHDSIKYIEANPIRRGLTSATENYKWSSAYARGQKQGLIPDTFNLPVAMPNPQRQRIGVFY